VNELKDLQNALTEAQAKLRELDLRRRELVTEIQDLREKVQAKAFSTGEKSGACHCRKSRGPQATVYL
jgi:cell division protein FtsB